MNKLPKISIVIPSYNKVKYIGETLQSIVDQDYPNLEVIIQDGGSTDGTWEIIQQYINRYPGTIRGERKKDKGQWDAINKGFKKATGDIFTFINSDDLYEKGALMTVAKSCKKNPKKLWWVGFGKTVNNKGKELATCITIYKKLLTKFNNYLILLVVNYIMQPSVFFTSKTFRQFGPFTGVGNVVMEYEMWLKIGKNSMPKIINQDLSRFRITDDSITGSSYEFTLNNDSKIAKRFTKNVLIIYLHLLHNFFRRLIIKII